MLASCEIHSLTKKLPVFKFSLFVIPIKNISLKWKTAMMRVYREKIANVFEDVNKVTRRLYPAIDPRNHDCVEY